MLLACSQLIRIDKVLCHDFFDIGFYFFWESLLPEEVERATAKLKAILMKKELSLRVKQKLIDTIYFV